ncbi:MAG: hypothetical protein ACJAUP_002183 [Cellvibrionaceae bacterium]|jgi:hypothetical protein
MSQQELNRLSLVESIIAKHITQHQAAIHQSRPRRSCLGELIQIDGSPHDWLEERANSTLQDRLVKEMRLQGINTIAKANAFLPTFFRGASV